MERRTGTVGNDGTKCQGDREHGRTDKDRNTDGQRTGTNSVGKKRDRGTRSHRHNHRNRDRRTGIDGQGHRGTEEQVQRGKVRNGTPSQRDRGKRTPRDRRTQKDRSIDGQTDRDTVGERDIKERHRQRYTGNRNETEGDRRRWRDTEGHGGRDEER